MPSNIVLTQPDAVMPIGLMTAFAEDIDRPALLDGVWSGGETVRFAKTIYPRKTFRLARRLKQKDLDTLRTFLLNHKNSPFWFYHLRETQPVGSYDPTGQNPVGRYAVVWQGGMTQTIDMGRGNISLELREVAI